MQTAETLNRTAGRVVAVFDVLSHERMHLAFNEAYLRLLRIVFPDDRILFHARPGHVEAVRAALPDVDGIEFRCCAAMSIPLGLSPHNPLSGRIAARRCFAAMRRALQGVRPRLVSLLGVDSNLLALARTRGAAPPLAPLHLIMHSQLGDAMLWRSRNPWIRACDILSVLRRGMPEHVSVVALELGVHDSIAEVAPRAAPAVVTLEHPILRREWGPEPAPTATGGVRIGYLGHASRTKGFPIFADMAIACRRPGLIFEAIGIAAPDSAMVDMGGLARRPDPAGIPRAEYVSAVQALDLVCLPMVSRAYDFIASGTVSDAIAALKPVIAYRTRTLAAIAEKYGPFGYLAASKEDMFDFMRGLTAERFAALRADWTANLRRLRAARLPEALAAGYGALVG